MKRLRHGVPAVLLAAAVLLSGCGGSGATPSDGLDENGLSTELVEVAPGLVVAKNRGAIVGSVRDEANFTVSGARVSLAGENHFGNTDKSGGFRFLNVTPGRHVLIVTTSAYRPAEVPVEVAAAAVANVTIHLLPLEDRGAGYVPHLHDYWGDRTEVVLMDRDVTIAPTPQDRATALAFVGAQTGSNNNISWVLPIVGDVEDRAVVYPGTAEVHVTLSWNPSQITLPRMGLSYASAFTSSRVHLPPKPNGSTWVIPVNDSMADSGHQKFSLWSLWAYSGNSYNQPTAYQPHAALGPIHVKMLIRKGGLSLEPAHIDYWAAGNVLMVRNPAVAVNDIGLNPTRTNTASTPNLGLDTGMIVPPGTYKLRIEFRVVYAQQQGTNTYDYDLTWRTGSQNPHTTRIQDFSRANPTRNDPDHKIWELVLKPEDTDAFYQKKSNWLFSPWAKPWPEDGTYLETRGRLYHLGVWAEKDPNYRDG